MDEAVQALLISQQKLCDSQQKMCDSQQTMCDTMAAMPGKIAAALATQQLRESATTSSGNNLVVNMKRYNYICSYLYLFVLIYFSYTLSISLYNLLFGNIRVFIAMILNFASLWRDLKLIPE